MEKEEIKKFLDDTKVCVNGKSKEIQEKLFSFGYYWNNDNKRIVNYINKPFLYIGNDKTISYGEDMNFFIEDRNREITADEILYLDTNLYYRPCKNKGECWEEMLKHQPFGWIRNKKTNNLYNLSNIYKDEDEGVTKIATEDFLLTLSDLFDSFVFIDGTPFGIKES